MIDAYDGSIAYLDDQLGRLLERLEDRGTLENTIVIVTSDHGEEFGEHGTMFHGHSLYMPLLHVPLVISYPPRVPARRIYRPVSLRDIPATILDLLRSADKSRVPGGSLVPSWSDGDDTGSGSAVLSEVKRNPRTPRSFPVHKGDMQSLVYGNMHYIRNGDGREELYDLASDPWEESDLAGSDRAQFWLSLFRKELDAQLTGQLDRGSSSR